MKHETSAGRGRLVSTMRGALIGKASANFRIKHIWQDARFQSKGKLPNIVFLAFHIGNKFLFPHDVIWNGLVIQNIAMNHNLSISQVNQFIILQ